MERIPIMKTEEVTVEPTEKVIEVPTGENATLELGGTEFAAKLKAAEERKAAEAVEPAKTEPLKKAEQAKDKSEAVKGKTPLDVTPAEKKEEPPAVEEELKTLIASEPPPNASASSKANHAAMRKGLERANVTITELKAKLQEASSKSAAPAEIEERLKVAEQTAKDYEAELERVAFERSPRFQKFVKDGEAELIAAKSYLDGADAVKSEDGTAIDPNVIDLAARATGSKRHAILTQSGMDASTIGLVASHLARADAINRERAAAQENWKATQADWMAEQTKAAEVRAAQVKQNEDKVFSDVGKKVAETLAPFQRVEGNDEWNAGVDGRLKEAQEFFDGKKPLHETAQLIYEGIAGRVYKDAFEDVRTKYNELVAENERTKAARPGAASTSQEAGKIETTGDPMKIAGSTFEENRARSGL
jgi:hypothetical protein